MSISITITESDLVTPLLAQLNAVLDDRTKLNEYIAGQIEVTTADYLRELAQTRHASANALGAAPTGHLERAANSVHSSWDADAATVGITSPGISRVAGDLTIRPVNGKFLTIPANAMAYGHRASEVAREIGGLRFQALKGGPALVHDNKDGSMEVFYWLRTEVTLPQDRTLLPSDESYLNDATIAAENFFVNEGPKLGLN